MINSLCNSDSLVKKTLNSIILEGNARLLMECIESKSIDLSLNGVLLHDIGCTLKAHFVPRQCNKVANALAHTAKSLGSQIWVDVASSCILEFLAQHLCV